MSGEKWAPIFLTPVPNIYREAREARERRLREPTVSVVAPKPRRLAKRWFREFVEVAAIDAYEHRVCDNRFEYEASAPDAAEEFAIWSDKSGITLALRHPKLADLAWQWFELAFNDRKDQEY